MGQERQMRKVGHSWVVAVPPRVREHLGVKHAQHLHWHLTGPKEAVLSPNAQRVGGKPPGLALASDLDGARRRITQLEAQLKAQPAAVLAEARMQEWMRRLRLELKGYPALDAINDRLRDIQAHLGMRRGPWKYRAKRGAPRTETVPGPDSYPARSAPSSPSAQVHEEGRSPARPIPDPPLSPGVVEQGADTSGRQPQVSHSKT
ncbi:MAG TPA: hypothetical protein VK547_06590 [Candidatus Udaeobacter sp.]|nr:hypothetical protein [Candidatus Udaeobacter sp.]